MTTTPDDTNDSWIGQPEAALIPLHTPAAPSEAQLRAELKSAPPAPKQEKDDVKQPAAGHSKRRTGSSRGDEGGAAAPPDPPRRRDGGRKHGEIFDDCPVTPLGVRGQYSYFLDVLGQLQAINKLDAQTIQRLFGHAIPRLCYNFPQWAKDDDGGTYRKPNRFDQTTASMIMYEAASECGLFNPENAVRGVGAWKDDDGNLIYHLGDKMIVGGEIGEPRRLGRHIYPAYPPIPRPAMDATGPDPVPDILDVLETWGWMRPDVHPTIALGMIGVQMLGGALDWRPTFWLTSAAGGGKSMFQQFIRLLHGEEGLIRSEEATKSGITAKLGHSSLPVALDELEPGDERSNKEKDIITLARIAASGGEWLRGSSDQTGVGGKVFSTFLFSSILIPGIMKAQDVQRLIRLDMAPLPKDAKKLSLVPKTWRARGARLKRILIDRWPAWPDHLAAWRESLEAGHVAGRDADNWSTVLAMAHMMIAADIASEDVRMNWARKIALIVSTDADDTSNDAEAMLLHLMGQPYDIYRRGEHYTVAQWVMVAAALPGAPAELMGGDTPIDGRARAQKANAKLAKAGLRVTPAGGGQEARLFMANAAIPNLMSLFQGSDWAGGAWKQSAARVPGAVAAPNPLTLAGMRSRGTLMPIDAIPGLSALPMDRDLPDASGSGFDESDFA